jgi:hypothetical protein
MVVLEILGIVIGVFSAAVGFSYKLYLLLNFRILYADHAYVLLMRDKKLEDRNLVQYLLRVVTDYVKPLDTPEFAQYGMLRRGKETARLEMKVGEIERGPNYVGIHPIYGYNSKGEVTLQADKATFYEAYRESVKGGQQRMAFRWLLVAFLTELLAVFVHF